MTMRITPESTSLNLGAVDGPSTERLTFLTPAKDPEGAISAFTKPGTDPIMRMWRPGFNHFIAEMPAIDAKQSDQTAQVTATREVLTRMADLVVQRLPELNIPHIGDGQFGRIILAIEEPKNINGKLVAGTEVVLAIWGKGFSSPVHGHAAGYLHEQLIQGAFDVHLFQTTGPAELRQAFYNGTIQQNQPGIFYSEFNPDRGQEKRSNVIHSFVAREHTISLHYLAEHVRNGSENIFTVINTPDSAKLPSGLTTLEFRPGFEVTADDLTKVKPSEFAQTYQVGDVVLARSKSVPYLGPHFAVIASEELIEKPHGMRPRDISIPIPHSVETPLNQHDASETVVLLKLNDDARERFLKHYGIRL